MSVSRLIPPRIVALFTALIAANVAAWAWAIAAFHDYPVLLGTALLAYSFGLRHAVDADHIAAIDNVTRKLLQTGQRSATVGLYFSLGHSTVVVLASLLIALGAGADILSGQRGEGSDRAERDDEEAEGRLQHVRSPVRRWCCVVDDGYRG